ncbi:MAG: NAD(P)-dependent oxidoreductase [Microgenomates group bacterium]
MSLPKTILITGGSGFLGINLTRFLLKKGYRVIVYDIAKFDYPEKDKVTCLIADVRDRTALKRALRGVDVVVSAAAALPLYPRTEILSTTIDGTRNVLEISQSLGIKRVIYISSTAVYGIPDHHPLLEDDKLYGVGAYGEAKVEAENICNQYRQNGFSVPVIRPKSFVGPERLGVFSLFYDWAKDGKNFPMMGDGKNKYQLLDVEDLCQAIFTCITGKDSQVNHTFNIGAKEFTTMKADYQAVLDFAGFHKKIICFPKKPMITALRILEFFHLSPLYKWVYETAGEDSFVSIAKAEKLLGYKPKFSNKQALIRNYKWYLANLDKFTGLSGVSHRVPWSQGILTLVKICF